MPMIQNFHGYRFNASEALIYPRDLIAKAPKPVQVAAKAYDEAVTAWKNARSDLEALRSAAQTADADASIAALEAVRAGKPLPPSPLDGMSAVVDAGARAADSALTVAVEAEDEFVRQVRNHEAALAEIAENVANDATAALEDALTTALQVRWDAYKAAHGLLEWLSHPNTDMRPQNPSGRSYGQQRTAGDLLTEAMRLIHASSPAAKNLQRTAKNLQCSPEKSDHERAARLLMDAPEPAWTSVLDGN